MKRITAAIAGLALAIAPAIGANVEFKNESINYKVMFKWGMVNKQAGHATLSIRNNGSQYITKLTAASESWADHFTKCATPSTASSIMPSFARYTTNE